MKKILLLLVLVSNSFLYSQTYPTGTVTITFNDPLRSGGFGSGGGPGRQIQTEVYYPAISSGSNVAVATGSFPVVVIGHGFVMDWNSYDNVYAQLSQRGYIVVLPRTEGSFSPNHSDFGKDLAIVGNKMLQLNTTNTLAPIFSGKVLQKLALSGHSMGGGSSFLGASNNASITCLVNFAAAQTNPRSSLAAKTVTVPSLILGGQNDCVAPYSANQSQMWDSTTSAIKFAINLKNLTHCDFGNGANFNCTFGQNTSGCSNTTSNSLALKYYMNFLNPFLDALLKGNCAAGTQFMDSISFSNTIFSKKILGTLACSPTSIKENNQSNVAVFPNPAQNTTTVLLATNLPTEVFIYSLDGKTIASNYRQNNNKIEVTLTDLESGVYFLRLENSLLIKTVKLIKQ